MTNLANILSVEETDFFKKTKSLEALFKVYFQTKAAGNNAATPITELIELISQLEGAQQNDLLESTQMDYPDHQVLLTKALVYLIKTYGLDPDLTLNAHALGILRDYRVLRLAHQNNHQLIYEINRAIKKRKEEIEIHKNLDHYRSFLQKTIRKKEHLEGRVLALSRFMYYVEHPLEEEEMEESLKNLIEDFEAESDEVTLLTYMAVEKPNWTLLNTIYLHYRHENPLGVEDYIRRLERLKINSEAKDALIADMRLVDHVHVFTAKKTASQARWMAAGGFAFGMELVMAFLQFITLATSLGAWQILGISLACCPIFGTFIGMYFHSGHIEELKKMNEREYFEKVKNIPANHDWSKGEIIGHIGTFEEGAAAATLLLTVGGMILLDTLSRAILGGDYDSPMSIVPGYYFITEVLMVCQWGWYFPAVAAIGAILYSTYKTGFFAMKPAHYALDVPNSIAYYNKLDEETEMRGVVNKDTASPLYFSQSLKWRHQISSAVDEFKEEYFPSEKPVLADI